MIVITQLIYIVEGQEAAFDTFERAVLPLIANYSGKLLLRLRPGPESFIEYDMEKPYEVHLVAFATQKDLDGFLQDEERKKMLHLKEQSVKASVVIQGTGL